MSTAATGVAGRGGGAEQGSGPPVARGPGPIIELAAATLRAARRDFIGKTHYDALMDLVGTALAHELSPR